MTPYHTLCIQCSLKALLNGEDPPVFNESVDAHYTRVHPDAEAMRREREELEKRLKAKMRIPHVTIPKKVK